MMHPTGNPDEYTLTTDNGKNNLNCGISPNYGDLWCNKGQTPDTFKLSNNCLQLKTQNGYINCKPDSAWDGGGISCSPDYTSCDNRFDMNSVSQNCSCWESTSENLDICNMAQKVTDKKCVSEYSPGQVSKNWDIANTSHNPACHNTCSSAFGKAGWQGVWHNVAGSADPHTGASCEDKGWSAGCDCPSQKCHWY